MKGDGAMRRRSMWAERAEGRTVENVKEVYTGLSVAGIAANAVFEAPRIGPILGHTLLPERRVTEIAVGIL